LCSVAVVRDITELKQIEEALQESETRYRSVLDTATDVVVTTDLTGRIETVNAAFESQTGWTRDGWLGRSVLDFLDVDEAKRAMELLHGLARGATPETREWRIRTSSGEWRVAEVKVSLYKRGGEPAGLLLIARDITDRRRAEDERTRLEDQVAQGRKVEAVGQLAGGIAHDFNNILQAVLGFASLAEEELAADSVAAQHLKRVIQAGERAQTLTRQLLTFSRREKTTPKVLDPFAVLGEFNQILRRVLPANISLSLTADAPTPSVVADRGHVEQIAMNLCVNARDAMPDGGAITVTVGRAVLDQAFAAAHVWARPGDFVTIAVADTGSGIAADVLPHIFEPFFTTKDVGQGTGLGLATVHAIVTRYDGLIDVQSTVGRGTAFRTFWPVHLAPSGGEENRDGQVASVRGRNELILVAEDDPLARELAVSQLERAGYRVLAAADGVEAVALFEAHATDIRLAFLDVMMPRGDGRSVRRIIGASRPELPVLFATGYVDRERLRGPFDDIADPVLDKPYTPAALTAKVRELLDASKS
jgi:two-component system, cell cycle sensor histidine kinase and response regulator CckA